MFWKTGLVLVALTFGQVPAGPVKPGFFIEDGIDRVSNAGDRIISGWEAYPGQIPYIVALRFFNLRGEVLHCAGSVVHRSKVLTAAHCTFLRISAVVSAGVTNLTTTPEYISETTEWWAHPRYVNSASDPNDIAILNLRLLLPYSKLVQPIRIQTTSEAFADYDDEIVIASGWGRLRHFDFRNSDVLNWVYLRVISNQECSMYYLPSSVTDNHICTRGYNVTSQSTCHGDNGGPLVHVGRDGEPVLVGIAVFWTVPGCLASPPVFIRPGIFHDWLTDATGLDFENLNGGEVTETPEPPTPEATETPATEATEPPTTEPPKPPTTEAPQPPTSVEPKPPTTEVSNLSTTEATNPPTTVAPMPPTTAMPEPPTSIVPKPPTTEVPNLSTTQATNPPTTVAPRPPTTAAPEPPTSVVPKPPTTEAPKPSTTEVTKPSTTVAPKPPTVEVPEPDSEETDNPEESKVFNKRQVNKVKITLNFNNFK